MCWLDLNIEIKKYTVSDWKRSVNEAVIVIKRERRVSKEGDVIGEITLRR